MRRSITAMTVMSMTACALDPDPAQISDEVTGPTAHPIVLVHGMMGFDELFGSIPYWNGITDALEADGHEVHVVTASQAGSPSVRGEQIILQLDALGGGPYNLIAHSQGGLDARYIAARRPDLVVSVTSIGTPHQGSPVADFFWNAPIGPLDEWVVQGGADMIKLLSGSSHPNQARPAIEALTTAGAAAFNSLYPAGVPSDCGDGAHVVDGIRYYSWSGTSPITMPLDPSDPMLAFAAALIPDPRNDGLVPRCSSHLGKVIRDDYPQNHLDQVNHMVGLVSPFGPRPVKLFRDHAKRLRDAGL